MASTINVSSRSSLIKFTVLLTGYPASPRPSQGSSILQPKRSCQHGGHLGQDARDSRKGKADILTRTGHSIRSTNTDLQEPAQGSAGLLENNKSKACTNLGETGLFIERWSCFEYKEQSMIVFALLALLSDVLCSSPKKTWSTSGHSF